MDLLQYIEQCRRQDLAELRSSEDVAGGSSQHGQENATEEEIERPRKYARITGSSSKFVRDPDLMTEEIVRPTSLGYGQHKCNCKTKGCSGSCSCRKWGAYCTSLCRCCFGEKECSNPFKTRLPRFFGYQTSFDGVFANACFASFILSDTEKSRAFTAHDFEELLFSPKNSHVFVNHRPETESTESVERPDYLVQWRKELDTKPVNTDERDMHMQALFRNILGRAPTGLRHSYDVELATGRTTYYWSFCMDRWVDQAIDNVRHCWACGKCYETRKVWHCGECRKCRADLYEHCSGCGGISMALDRAEEIAEGSSEIVDSALTWNGAMRRWQRAK